MSSGGTEKEAGEEGGEAVVVRKVVPGEVAAVIEEATPGSDCYLESGNIRSLKVGRALLRTDLKELIIDGVKLRSKPPGLGDQVIGLVEETLPEGMQRVLVLAINNVASHARFSTVLVDNMKLASSKNDPPSKIGDLVRARVVSVVEGVVLATLSGREFGVLWTSCSKCRGDVSRYGISHVRCRRCGNIEYRKLAPDFKNPSPFWWVET